MSRHSKWAKIKHSKGVTDQKRGALFTKLTRAITVAARQNGGDPNFNFALRLSIDAAKQQNVPKENIEKAIKRGTGELKDEAAIEEVLYEGFGPASVPILIKTATDNKNRTVSDLKQILSRHNGSLAGRGAVAWQFEEKGVARVKDFLPQSQPSHQPQQQSQNAELALIDAGAEDIKKQDEFTEIICPPARLQSIVDALTKLRIEILESGLEFVPKERAQASKDYEVQLQELLEALDEHDDVQAVFINA